MDVLTSGASAELTLFSTVILAVEGLTLWQVPQIFEAEKKSCNSIGAPPKRELDVLWEALRQEPNISSGILLRLGLQLLREKLRKCRQWMMLCGLRFLMGLRNCLNPITHLLIYSIYFTVPLLALYVLNSGCQIFPVNIRQCPQWLAKGAFLFLAAKFAVILATVGLNRLFSWRRLLQVTSPTATVAGEFSLSK